MTQATQGTVFPANFTRSPACATRTRPSGPATSPPHPPPGPAHTVPPCAAKSSTASATTVRSAHASGTQRRHIAAAHVFHETAQEGLLQPPPRLRLRRAPTARLPRPTADVWMSLGEDATLEARVLLLSPRFQNPSPSVGAHHRTRDAQEDVPRHGQQMPSERHPFHTSGCVDLPKTQRHLPSYTRLHQYSICLRASLRHFTVTQRVPFCGVRE